MLKLKCQCSYLSLQGLIVLTVSSRVSFMSIFLQGITSLATIWGLFVLQSSLFQRKCPMNLKKKKTQNTDSYN